MLPLNHFGENKIQHDYLSCKMADNKILKYLEEVKIF